MVERTQEFLIENDVGFILNRDDFIEALNCKDELSATKRTCITEVTPCANPKWAWFAAAVLSALMIGGAVGAIAR